MPPQPPGPACPCDLPGCHAPVTGQGVRYCCADHGKTGRNIANIRSRAKAAEENTLREALAGTSKPPEHVGFLATTDGTVLTGQALVELRAAISLLRSTALQAEQATTQPGATYTGLRARVRALKTAADAAADKVERVLP